jgi:hypothetical protein
LSRCNWFRILRASRQQYAPCLTRRYELARHHEFVCVVQGVLQGCLSLADAWHPAERLRPLTRVEVLMKAFQDVIATGEEFVAIAEFLSSSHP